jgi:2-polyprenyl-6-methoxyphenol hydroxylase-like FAD-dependent oxidoreductase
MTGLWIAIVGAGVAGLAAASFLADAGYELVIFERFEIARPLGAGLLIQPTGLAALESLGVRTEAMLLGSRIDHLWPRRTERPRDL